MAIELNSEQKPIVHWPIESKLKVMAGAGTGKTRALTERYLRFVFEDGVSPDRLLALTFTKKAAAEMQQRVFEGVAARGESEQMRELYGAWIMNFHQFAYRIILDNAADFGVDPDTSVASEVDIVRAERRLAHRFHMGSIAGLPERSEDDMPTPNDLAEYYDRCYRIMRSARDRMWTPDELRATQTSQDLPQYRQYVETVIAIWRAYESELHTRKLFDFADLIRIVVQAFRTRDNLRRRYSERFTHILVDEFQDTSEAQNALLECLAGNDFSRVTVVGDEKQSIYRWRDACVDNIRNFASEEKFLQKNYRSHQNILDLAYELIIRDPYFAGKKEAVALHAQRDGVERPICVFHPPDELTYSAVEEAKALGAWVVGLTTGGKQRGFEVHAELGEPLAYGDIAILMRTLKPSSGLPAIEAELQRLRVPYAILGGVSAVEGRVLQRLTNLFRLLLDDSDVLAFLDVVQSRPFDVPDGALLELVRRKRGQSFAARRVLGGASLEAIGDRSAAARLSQLRELLESLEDRLARLDLAAFVVEAIERTPLLLQLFEEDADTRIVASISKRLFEIIEGLIARGEANLSSFVESVQTLLEKKQFGEEDAPYVPAGRVVIMTQHQAKGLEFAAVAVPGIRRGRSGGDGYYLERGAGIFASVLERWGRGSDEAPGREDRKAEQEQEERCLMYVAITRAKDHLFLSSPFPNGEERGKASNFADLLDIIEQSGIVVEQRRQVAAVAPVGTDEGAAGAAEWKRDEVAQLLTEWASDRTRLDEARAVMKPVPQGIHFVTWRGLHTYSQCPLQYYQRYIAAPHAPDTQSPQPEESRVEDAGSQYGIAPDEFGRYMHDVLFERARAGAAVSVDARESVETHASALVASLQPQRPQLSIATLAERWQAQGGSMNKLVAVAEDMVERFEGLPELGDATVRALELPVRRRCGGVVVHGIVDRIDRAGDVYRVVDYKVGRPREDYAFQIQSYAWLLSSIYDGALKQGAVVYLGDSAEWHPVDVAREAVDRVQGHVEALAGAVKSGHFPAEPGQACGQCDYREHCAFALR